MPFERNGGMRARAVLLVALLVPLAGCLPDSEPAKCSAWTLNDTQEHPYQAHVHVVNERASSVCVAVSFGGEEVAKVPLQPAQEEAVGTDEHVVDWAEPRITVRADEWEGDRWTTATVDLERTPHVEIAVLEDELRIDSHVEPP